MKPIYAIGDVHGQFDKLADALELIEDDGGPDARVVVLGDLVDRGPDAFRVIELLRLGCAEGRDWTVLLGNHDQMFLEFLRTGETHHHRIVSGISWLNDRMGGKTTLASYGVDTEQPLRDMQAQARALVPQSHVDFLNELPLVYETGGLLFVHAGLMPGVTLEEQNPEDLLWIREPFLSHEDPFEWLVVHGHTAIDAAQHYGNRVNLDSGAGRGGDLSVAVFEDNDVLLLTPMGRAVF
ncbi:metallophosphoesterase family protein [Primorskyibacter sp. S187A]|uniref:metallophosphoesterase family protein n=1 Tax=Primorskyibacter sp. S187A TaxID=3415130 RepID=UPI003C7AB589